MENNETSFKQRIGNTTFFICVKQSETAKKPIDTVFKDICRHEALGDFFVSNSFNYESLEKIRKTS